MYYTAAWRRDKNRIRRTAELRTRCVNPKPYRVRETRRIQRGRAAPPTPPHRPPAATPPPARRETRKRPPPPPPCSAPPRVPRAPTAQRTGHSSGLMRTGRSSHSCPTTSYSPLFRPLRLGPPRSVAQYYNSTDSSLVIRPAQQRRQRPLRTRPRDRPRDCARKCPTA